jgi:hypothetical protein
MNITKKIKSHISQLPEAKAFTAASLHHLASADTVRKVLGRLANTGEIERIARGVFAKPKQTRFGTFLPSALETMEAIAKTTGETLTIHGAEAAQRLHLSTQIPLQLVLYTSGKSRKIKIRNRVVSLQHISPRKMIAPNTAPGLVISALWYLGQEQVSVETIHKIANTLPKKEFEEVLTYTEQMPAWMANCFYEYNQQKAA